MARDYLLATIFGPQRSSTTSLKSDSKGVWFLTDGLGEGHIHAIALLEATDEGCAVCPANDCSLLSGGDEEIEEILVPFTTDELRLDVRDQSSGASKGILIIRKSTYGMRSHSAYAAGSPTELLIGSSSLCDIAYENALISASHSRVTFDGSSYAIEDLDSQLGTYVNGERLKSGTIRSLCSGDVVEVLDLAIMPAGKTLVVNSPSGVSMGSAVSQGKIMPIDHDELVLRAPAATPDDKLPAPKPFWPAPRLMRSVHAKTLRVDSPPPVKEPDDTPLIMRIGPSFLMGFASVFMAASAVSRIADGGNAFSAAPTIAMAVAMVAGMVIWPFISRGYDRRRAAKMERRRRSAYADYIAGVEATLRKERDEQAERLRENRVDARECLHRAETRSPLLMGRSPSEPDFLSLRLGLGEQELDANIRWPEASFTLDRDDLLEMAVRLSKNPPMLESVPLALSLKDMRILGIVGAKRDCWNMAQSLLVQASALWSYEDVHIAVIGSSEEEEEWRFIRELPHSLAPDGRTRLIASDEQGVREMSGVLGRELSQRVSRNEMGSGDSVLPHYIVLCGDRELAEQSDAINRVAESAGDLGFSLVYLSDTLEGLPKDCVGVIELSENGKAKAYDRSDVTSSLKVFSADSPLRQRELHSFAQSLARVDLGGEESSFLLPKAVGFLATFAVGNTADLDLAARWGAADASRSLAAPLGLDSRGGVVTLDPHESFDGPHGLVAGTTGSGKSELLITWILSTAVCFPPEQVAFVLIDYKGGGLADAFSRKGMELPHLAGTVTNLDGGEVQRSLSSLQAELVRRQRMLADAKKITGDATMDVASYQRHWSAGDVSEPMPHLYVVADEFAELKQQEPEFMDGLISAARIGRSLGVHLVLATQKPTGVVNDQISANSRFRVCLKVADASDSKEMIRRPDAAALEGPGRFILLVGYDERLCLGQAAWCGGPYMPSQTARDFQDDSVELCDDMGMTELAVRPRTNLVSNETELDAVLSELRHAASGRNARKLWLPPLEKSLSVEELKARYANALSGGQPWRLSLLVGELDDPARQQKRPLVLDLSDRGSAALYGAPGSGRTEVLAALLWGLLDKSPKDCTAYVIDADAGTLLAFDGAPQVPNVLQVTDTELIGNLFRMLDKEISQRQQLFGGEYVDLDAYNLGRNSEEHLPAILVVINGVAQVSDVDQSIDDRLLSVMRNGQRYGIHVLFAADSPNDIRFRLRSAIGASLVLSLASEDDYMSVLGSMRGTPLPKGRGRGLVREGDQRLSFQGAFISGDGGNPYSEIQARKMGELRQWGIQKNKIPVLPESISPADAAALSQDKELALGMLADDLEPLVFSFDRSGSTLVAASQIFQVIPFVQGVGTLAQERGARVFIVDPKGLLDTIPWWASRVSPGDVQARIEAPGSGRDLLLILDAKAALESPGSEWLCSLIERPKAHPGVLVFCAASQNDITQLQSKRWGQRLLSSEWVLWIGGGLSSAYALKVTTPSTQLKDSLGEDGGFAIQRGWAHPIRYVSIPDDEAWE